MKEGIHPNYRDVCFVDLSNGFKFVTRSCAQTRETIKMDDGRELPLFKVETTSESHPFYTGTQKSVDSLGGRVEKFRNKFARVGLKQAEKDTDPEIRHRAKDLRERLEAKVEPSIQPESRIPMQTDPLQTNPVERTGIWQATTPAPAGPAQLLPPNR